MKSEDQGVLTLTIVPKSDADKEEELKTRGFRIQYKLVSESWDTATVQDFKIGNNGPLRCIHFNHPFCKMFIKAEFCLNTKPEELCH